MYGVRSAWHATYVDFHVKLLIVYIIGFVSEFRGKMKIANQLFTSGDIPTPNHVVSSTSSIGIQQIRFDATRAMKSIIVFDVRFRYPHDVPIFSTVFLDS